jgi:uroporphyrinogen-III synthase
VNSRPLAGRTILVTRPAGATSLTDSLRELGAAVLELPTTRIDVTNALALRDAVRRLPAYQWLVFTSANAVGFFLDEARDQQADLGAIRIAAVGAATARALAAADVAVHVVPEVASAEGLVDAFRGGTAMAGARVLYPTAEGARDVLAEGVRALGVAVDVVAFYRSGTDESRRAALRAALETASIDVATFTSPSTVRGFVELAGDELAKRIPAVTIGAVTTAAAREAGLTVAGQAAEATVPGLVAAVVAALGA